MICRGIEQLQKCLHGVQVTGVQMAVNAWMRAHRAFHHPWAALHVLAGNILLVLEAAM